MHDTGLADRGRRGVAVGRRIITATVAAVVVRGLAWLVSLFIAGPVLGTTLFALLNESRLGKASAVVLEAALALMSIAASIAVAVGIRRDEPHWRPRARVVGWALIVDTVYYVSSIVVAALIWGGVSNLADLSWAIIIVATANVPLIWLGVAIIRLTRPMER